MTDVGLTGVKRRFTELTIQQINDFKKALIKLDDLFRSTGPGTVGKDLDHGLEILIDFKEKLKKYEVQRFAKVMIIFF